MLKQLYIAIEDKLKAITAADGSPLFRHFDLWNRQVEFLEAETPFQTPAVFVEFETIRWRTMGQNVQDADLTLRLHIVTPWSANTAANVTRQQRDNALSYLDLPTVVFRRLHGTHAQFANGGINTLVRTASAVNHDHERFVDSIEEYTCNIRDHSYGVNAVPLHTFGIGVEFAPHPSAPNPQP